MFGGRNEQNDRTMAHRCDNRSDKPIFVPGTKQRDRTMNKLKDNSKRDSIKSLLLSRLENYIVYSFRVRTIWRGNRKYSCSNKQNSRYLGRANRSMLGTH